MNDIEFWNIIDRLDWEFTGDDEAVVAPVVECLAKQSDEGIFEFEELLAQKLYALDTRAHAQTMSEDAEEDNYFTVDAFLYARCVVVANGQAFFEEVLKDSSEFPGDMEFEALLFVAQDAFEEKNDADWEYVSPTDYETYRNKKGWQ